MRRCTRDGSERTVDAAVFIDAGIWIAEVRVIENVERLGPKLEKGRFANVKILVQRHVEIHDSRPLQYPDRRVAVIAGGNPGERGRIQPVLNRLGRRVIIIANDIRVAVWTVVAAECRGERTPTPDRGDVRQLPPTEGGGRAAGLEPRIAEDH